MKDFDEKNTDETGQDSLEEKVVARVREWFHRVAPNLDRGREQHTAEITIRIHDRQGDEDDTLYLDATVEETRYDEFGGRVPGIKF